MILFYFIWTILSTVNFLWLSHVPTTPTESKMIILHEKCSSECRVAIFWMEAIYLEKILLILWHLQGSNSQLTNRMEYGLACHACRSKYNPWQNPYFLVSYVCQEVICLKIYILKNQLFFSISRWILNIFPICQFSVSRTCKINSSTEGSRPKHLCLSTVILTQTPFYL